MKYPVLILIASQALFSLSDFMARANMSKFGFKAQAFLSTWFVIYVLVRTIGTIAQLYVFSRLELGRIAGLLAVASLIFANVLGIVFLHEMLSATAYLGIILAVVAFVLLVTH